MIATAWLVILVGGLLTYALRCSFLFAADRLNSLPDDVREAFRLIPPAALAALALPAVLRPQATLVLLGPRPLAAIVALAVAWRTRSVFFTIALGMAAVVTLEVLLGD